MKNSETIHVVLAVYDVRGTYSQHAGVTMTSVFENTGSPVCVHVLHDDTLTDDNRRKFLRTAEKYGQSVELVDVTKYREQIDRDIIKLIQRTTWPVGCLYRLFIPDVLTVDKVIYLDCDVLVNLDIRELWDIDLEENCLAGVLDIPVTTCSFFSNTAHRSRLNGYDTKTYINSGVLVMDLRRIREWGDLLHDSMAWFTSHLRTALWPDQDALNALFFKNIKLVDEKFNRFNNYLRSEEEIAESIIHSVWPKSWQVIMGFPSEQLYWKFYIRSAWGEEKKADELIDTFCKLSSLALGNPDILALDYSWKQCAWRLVKGLLYRAARCARALIYMILFCFQAAKRQVRSAGR